MEENLQKLTNEVSVTPKTGLPMFEEKDLSDKHWQYIDFVALGGLLTDDDGKLRQMTVGEFASQIGVERATLYTWKKKIPDFWGKVEMRLGEIGTQARTNAVWKGVFLRAAKGDAEQAKIWLGTFGKWQPPSQKHEVEVGGGLADLLQRVREDQVAEDTANRRVIVPTEPTNEISENANNTTQTDNQI